MVNAYWGHLVTMSNFSSLQTVSIKRYVNFTKKFPYNFCNSNKVGLFTIRIYAIQILYHHPKKFDTVKRNRLTINHPRMPPLNLLLHLLHTKGHNMPSPPTGHHETRVHNPDSHSKNKEHHHKSTTQKEHSHSHHPKTQPAVSKTVKFKKFKLRIDH